jgi:hypothetical protein
VSFAIDAADDEGWVIIKLVDEEGRPRGGLVPASAIWNSCGATLPVEGSGGSGTRSWVQAAEHLPVLEAPRMVDARGPAPAQEPGRAVLEADSCTAGRASASKRRASTPSMRPYSCASAAVMK